MNAASVTRDLIALVADKNIEAALRALLRRNRALGTRRIQAEIYVHPGRDPGCLRRAHDFLFAQSSSFQHALVLLDRQGCGSEDGAPALEAEIENRLRSGWTDRARAIVIDPELEIWVWSDSPHVDEVLGWAGRLPGLRDWLVDERLLAKGALKPTDPKAAMDRALWAARIPRSSAIYARLAETVSFQRCQDRAFLRLRQTLANWFPQIDRHG
ncbi:MAG: hypothetical protein LC135_00595 [Phycisphaerae bacterium]|nr:hypothetical protein [Phycisphaerae bacterium]MCZ2398350.1 hypothetical protein [Phycisphaerae bacterium]NUQ49191.1 hypothetical protein [Phycisphaerae bacterium]